MNVAPSTIEGILVTIITPSYNRGHMLADVYWSLCDQNVTLEWVVVDDGSVDRTADIVKALAREAPFPILYARQEHAGKHIAVNHGVSLARGAMIGLLDSDDLLVPGALDRLIAHWTDIQDRVGYVGVTGLDIDESGHIIGDRFCADVIDASWQEMTYRHRVKGDKWGLQRADVLRAYPFPAEPGFVFEGTVWREIGKTYFTRYVNDVFLCVRSSGSDRLGKLPFARNAHAVVQHYRCILTEDLEWFTCNPIWFILGAARFSRALFHQHVPVYRQATELPRWSSRTLWAVAFPLGFLLYLRDRKSVAYDP